MEISSTTGIIIILVIVIIGLLIYFRLNPIDPRKKEIRLKEKLKKIEANKRSDKKLIVKKLDSKTERKKIYNEAKADIVAKIKANQKTVNYELNPVLVNKPELPGKLYYEAKPSEYFQRPSNFIRKWWMLRKARKNPATAVLIKMEMNNGRFREFIVREDPDKSGFMYNKGRYIFDNNLKYFLIDSNIWCYDYHEAFSMPIKRQIDVDEVKKAVEILKETDQVSLSTNPKTLQRFVDSEIAQGIMQGASLGALFKILLIVCIITLVLCIGILLFNLYSSGILQNINFG